MKLVQMIMGSEELYRLRFLLIYDQILRVQYQLYFVFSTNVKKLN